jgi:hypothetical protein
MDRSPGSCPTALGKIAVIPLITPAKILEPSSKELFTSTRTEERARHSPIDGQKASAKVCADDLRWEGPRHHRFSGILFQAHPIKLFDPDNTPETQFRKQK